MMAANTNRCKNGNEFRRVDLILYLQYKTILLLEEEGAGRGEKTSCILKKKYSLIFNL